MRYPFITLQLIDTFYQHFKSVCNVVENTVDIFLCRWQVSTEAVFSELDKAIDERELLSVFKNKNVVKLLEQIIC